MQLAGLEGATLVGYKIYIYAGKGAGQERTIMACTDPVIADQGPVTTYTAASGTIADASTLGLVKTWKFNQWRDYQIRLTMGTGPNQLRKILYNNATTVCFYDVNYSVLHSWHSQPLGTAAGNNATFYQIESSTITVDSNWTITPDNTSRFVVKSGGLWAVTGNATTFYNIQYYDILNDIWYNKSAQQSLLFAAMTNYDWAIETCGECEGGISTNGVVATPLTSNKAVVSVAASPYNYRTLIDAGQANSVQTVSINNAGTGGTYVVGDILALTTTGSGATVKVVAVNSGQVASITLVTGGTGYSAGSSNTSGGGGTGCTITIGAVGMAANKYANMMIRLTSGAGAGQTRLIIGNNTNTFIIGRDWDALPDSTTTYQVLGDSDKIWMIGNGYSGMYTYSVENDMMTCGRQFDYGVARTFTAQSVGTGIYTVSISAGGSNYQVNDILTLATGTGGTVKVLAVNAGASNAVTSVSIVNPGSGYALGNYNTSDSPANGSGCTINVTGLIPMQPAIGCSAIVKSGATAPANCLFAVTIGNNAGTNYNVNDLLTVSGGTGGIIRVTSVSAGGVVTGIAIENPGTTGYTVGGTNIGTGNSIVKNANATGLTINNTVTDTAIVTTAISHNFTIGDYVMIGGADVSTSQSCGTFYNGLQAVVAVPSATTFTFNLPSNCTVTSSTGTGIITAINTTPVTGGTGYTTGAIGSTGPIATSTLGSGGTGYTVGDLLAINSGTGGIIKVAAVTNGVINSFASGGYTFVSYGSGYTAGANGLTTTPLGNVSTTVPYACQGTGCTINVVTTGMVYSVTGGGGTGALIAVTATGAGGAATTVALVNGGSGYNAPPQTLTLTPIYTSTAGIIGGYAESATTMVDTTKNWQPNEHVGKILQIGVAGLTSVTNARRIIGNTSNCLMVTNTTAALGGQFTVNPVSGTHKYVIMDPKPFGTESTNKVPNQFAWGTATGGASTYLEDLNKNWIVNQWAGKKVKILAGSGVGNYPNEIPIASNTATRLTFGITGTTGTVTAYTLRSVETNPDATTVYAIMDNWGQSTGGGQFATAIGTGSGGSNYVAGDIVAVTGGSGFNNIYKVAGTGAVTNVMLLSVGTGYTAGTNLTTTPLTGCGSGLTLNTTAQTASLATTTITADFIQPVMGAIGTLIPVQNWGVATITSKRARLLSGLLANVCYESTVATGTANTLTITANGSNNIDGCSQYAILGISPRGVSNTTIGSGINLIRLFGTTYINKAQYMISWRGGGTSEVDRYDMVNDYWDYLTIFPVTETYTGGSMYEYNGKDRIYVTKDATGRVMYYDLVKNIIVPCSTIPYGHGTVLQGNRMFSMSTTDLFGSNLEYLYMMRHNASEMWRVLVYW